jgi:hypothetical protein
MIQGKKICDSQLTLINAGCSEGIQIIAYQLFIGGGRTQFVDLDQNAKLKTHEWNSLASKWRIVYTVLIIKGIRRDSKCETNGKMVCSNLQFTELDLLKDHPGCPMCKCSFKHVKPGFRLCLWCVDGIKST